MFRRTKIKKNETNKISPSHMDTNDATIETTTKTTTETTTETTNAQVMNVIETQIVSNSQLGQDIEVLRVFNNKRDGYFVEIGASDGVELSNTHLLEHRYNWKGICCEPIPDRFEKLVANRPNSVCYDVAVYKTTGDYVDFDVCNSYDLFSGIPEHIDRHKQAVESNKSTITVFTMSLLDVLNKANAPKFIEYLSIDTEGSELVILEGFNFTKYTFGLIDIEHNFIEPRRTEIRTLLELQGYKYKGENQWDDMYIHQSIV